MALDIFKTT